jgi:UDP-N-acetyl-D-mannosaminuronic acid dehydrogenase
MAFKADVDDIRDSLSYKLSKLLTFQGAHVLCSDEHVSDPSFCTLDEILARCEIVIIGVPHRRYVGLRIPAHIDVVDLWNVTERADA